MEPSLLPVDEVRAVFGAAALDGGAEARAEQVYEPVASASSGIWRVTVRDRSAVLKLVRHAEGNHPSWRSGDELGHWYYWRREVLAYESGLLADLPGQLRAPRCELIATRADESVALWLEDLPGAPAPQWPLARYGRAARHLGQMQGTYLSERTLPDAPWLSQGWLRSYLAQRDADLDLVDDRSCWEHPLVAPWFAAPPIERLHAMRADQARLLDLLDRLPQTLCHFDMHPDNLFADGDDCTAVIDWSFMGIGALGHDAATLIGDSVLDFHVAPADIERLFTEVVHGYTTGLRATGWDGDETSLRQAIDASIAARYAWIAPAILRAVSEDQTLLNRRPIAESMQWWGPTVTFLLDRADEARAAR